MEKYKLLIAKNSTTKMEFETVAGNLNKVKTINRLTEEEKFVDIASELIPGGTRNGAGERIQNWIDNIGTEVDGITTLLKPNMIVDFDWVNENDLITRSARLRNNLIRVPDTDQLRAIISQGAPNNDHWAIGPRGWIIVGFGNGFIPSNVNEIRFTEIQLEEWVDIWVAKGLPKIDDHKHIGAVHRGAKEPVRIKTLNTPRANLLSIARQCENNNQVRYIAQPRDTFTELHPYREVLRDGVYKYLDTDERESNLADLPEGALICDGGIPKGWVYIGSLKGSGGVFNPGPNERRVRTVPGPHLGFLKEIDPQRHHYILITDSTPRISVEGPGLIQIGIAQTDRRNLDHHFHLLIIDDSASVTGRKVDFLRELLTKVQRWAEGPSTNKYLGIRLIKWQNGVTNARKCRTTVGGIPTISATTYASKFGGTNWTSRPNWDELTVRLTMDSLPGDKPFGNLWVKFSTDNWAAFESQLRNFLDRSLNLNNDETPFVETLDDVLFRDMEELRPRMMMVEDQLKVPLEILIVSDGIPDPFQQFNTLADLCTQTSTSSGQLMPYLAASGAVPRNYSINTYNVESKMKFIGENTVQSHVKIISNLRCAGQRTNWIQQFYQSPPMADFVRYELRPEDGNEPIVIRRSAIDERKIAHTDSTNTVYPYRINYHAMKRIGLIDKRAYPVFVPNIITFIGTNEMPCLRVTYQNFVNWASRPAVATNPIAPGVGEDLNKFPLVVRHFYNKKKNRWEYIVLKKDKKFIHSRYDTANNQWVHTEGDALVLKRTNYGTYNDDQITMNIALSIIADDLNFECISTFFRAV
jgi:hypothetical protein